MKQFIKEKINEKMTYWLSNWIVFLFIVVSETIKILILKFIFHIGNFSDIFALMIIFLTFFELVVIGWKITETIKNRMEWKIWKILMLWLIFIVIILLTLIYFVVYSFSNLA